MDICSVCIFAYGQTGSGKTHTMEGPSDDRGVNFRAMAELFRVRDERMLCGNFDCDMKLSILEVYNDGSTCSGDRKALEVRMSKQGAFVDNLMEVEVHSTADVADLMALGHSHRSVGAHDVNEHSSRSHLVLSITITTSQKSDPSKKTTSKLHLIDLAGSERISTFPVQWNASESLCSLNFAQRCRNVALGQLKSPPPSTSTTLPPSASVPKPATKAPKQSGALSATDKVRVTCSTGPKSPRKDMT
ncbi:hypothetical protein DYB36_014142 [Aphanomyces astaci]|uniref:Kinesin motor domain-containing protein n=1 Tax=Aphanomyces astaci TaxID=112090 RepID=A0A397BQX8_APHAT|nr:hypothetical protein DYB36_014142 [Aphanomyces astaci]